MVIVIAIGIVSFAIGFYSGYKVAWDKATRYIDKMIGEFLNGGSK